MFGAVFMRPSYQIEAYHSCYSVDMTLATKFQSTNGTNYCSGGAK